MKSLSRGLTGNMLKLLALVCMTIDHVGLFLLPRYTVLRVIGRLAFPIFAWMIAEGCRHTRSMGKYLGTILLVGLLYQAEFICLVGSLKMNIMITFSLSVGLCWLLKLAEKDKIFLGLALTGVVAAWCITDVLPVYLEKAKFGIDYGFFGVLLPVLLYLARDKRKQLVFTGIMLALLALWTKWPVQWAGLLAVPLLALYNGDRGKRKIKWLFYIYYPAHLTVLWILVFLFRK